MHQATRNPVAVRTIARALALSVVAGMLLVAAGRGPVGAALVESVAPGQTGNVTDFPVSSTVDPHGVAAGSDGKVWFTDNNNPGAVGNVDPATRATTTVQPPTVNASPEGIVAGSDGRMWFAEAAATPGRIGAVIPGGALTEYTVTNSPTALTEASDGNVWFAANGPAGGIGRITPGGSVSTFTLPPLVQAAGLTAEGPHVWATTRLTLLPNSTSIRELNVSDGSVVNTFNVTGTTTQLGGIAVGSDGQIYFAAQTDGFIGKMDPATGAFTRTTVTGSPISMTKGPDGNVWFTANAPSGDYIGSLAPGGSLVTYTVGVSHYFSTNAAPVGITTGPDGNIWASAQGQTPGAGPNNELIRLEIQPTATLTPNPVTFTTTTVNGTSTQTATFAISGGGGATLTAAPAATGDFSVTGGTCGSGTVLPASGSCSVQVMFKPSAAGARAGTLSVTSTAAGSPQTVPLSGTGTSVASASGGVLVVPPVTNFFSQAIGTTATARVVSLVNGGSTTATVSSVGVTGTAGGDFVVAPGSDHCTGASVAPGGFCTVLVSFNPRAEGVRAGVIVFVDNATNSPQLGVLLGRGVHQAGYWLSGSDGGIFSFPATATFYGSTGSMLLNKPIVGIATTPDGGGYWEVATDGGIFAFGDARFFGSTGSIHLNSPIVGMAATPSGLGYWLVAADGGIFAYGDALFFGSTGSIHLNKPIVGMATTQDGLGYWLVATDGGIFAYGDAAFHGSTGSIKLNQPIVGMAPGHDGSGYWLVASDGGIFAFNAAFLGSTGSIHLNKPIVGMAATPTGAGYWMVATDGGIFSFPDAQFFGSTGSMKLNKPIVGMAPIP